MPISRNRIEMKKREARRGVSLASEKPIGEEKGLLFDCKRTSGVPDPFLGRRY